MCDELTVKSQPLPITASREAVIAAIARGSNPAILDSAATGPSRGRFTILACDPVAVASWRMGCSDPFEGMRQRLAGLGGRIVWAEGEPPAAARAFPGGWIGYFTYEAGRYIERLPATTDPDIGLPIARFALYDTAAIHDAVTNEWILVAADLSGLGHGAATRQPAEDRLADWTAWLRNAESPAPVPPPLPEAPEHNMTRVEYERMVARAIDYIAAGDIFQVNLARRETFPVREPAIATYLRLRQTNPGAYAAYLGWNEPAPRKPVGPSPAGEVAILSSSPELFLRLKDRDVVTRPIKGTRPRSDDPITDASYQMALAASEKDRAELAMIVDLERNDLGRVCEFGSLRVVAPDDSAAAPYALEAHPTVFHLVAEVTGRLADRRDAIDLVRACFPGGSITGAPKVRAMEIIDELEPTERSVYTGAIGYFGLDGSMMLNIAIRTLMIANRKVHLYAGGGIVADSQPEDEYRETQAKALGLSRAINATGAPAAGVLIHRQE